MTRSLILKSLVPFTSLFALVACGTAETTEDTRALELVEEVATMEVETTETPPIEELEVLEPVALELEVVLTEPPEELPSFEVEVRSGENLVLISDWAELSVEEIVAANAGLDPAEPLMPGQSLAIPLPEEDESAYQANRQAFVDAKLQRYMDRRGGLVGVREHRVRTGDTAWGLASGEADIPMWVLSEFNRDADLERLRIGDKLSLPVLGDSVNLAMEEPEPEELEESIESPRLEPESL